MLKKPAALLYWQGMALPHHYRSSMHAPVAQGHALRKTFSASCEACATIYRGRRGARFRVPYCRSSAPSHGPATGTSFRIGGNLPYVMPRHTHSIGPKRYRLSHQLLKTTCALNNSTVGISPIAGPTRPYSPVV